MAFPVGVSELAGRTFGKQQVMTQEQAGRQLRMAIIELELEYDIIVTVNEGDRSRPDQDIVWQEYLHGGPLAARCYTSTHDPVNHGNAGDLGGKGGAVISDAAVALLDKDNADGRVGKKYGIQQTGKYFSRFEKWHFNVFPAAAQVIVTDAMLADAERRLAEKRNPTPSPEEDDMAPRLVRVLETKKVSFIFPTYIRDTTTSTEITAIGRAFGVIPAHQNWEDYVDDIAQSEYDAAVDITRAARRAIAANVWAHTFASGNIAGTVLDALVNFPKKVWQYRFNSGAQAGASLQDISKNTSPDADQATEPKDA